MAVGVRSGRGHFSAASVALAEPRADLGVGHGLAAVGIEHEAFDEAIAAALAHNDGEVAGPEACIIANVVCCSEVFSVAADEIIKSLRHSLGWFNSFDCLVIVDGGGQFDAPFLNDFLAEQGGAFVVVEPIWIAAFAFHCRFPILGYHAEVDLIHITVLDGDLGLRVIPNALNGDVAALGLNLDYKIVALRAAGSFWECVCALEGDFVGLHFVTLLVE